MKQGLQPVTDVYSEISVLYANILVLGDSGWAGNAEKSLSLLNDLVIALDDAAERRGIEKLSSNGATYVACCGMSEQRLDQASRIVDFAQDVLRTARRLDRERHASVQVQIGVDSGPAAGGIVGRTRFSYYVSGETMSTAYTLAGQALPDTVLISRHVHDSAENLYQFHSPIQVATPGGDSVTAWPLKSTEARSGPSQGSAERQGVGRG
jgi:class 3 adenylate cyclase